MKKFIIILFFLITLFFIAWFLWSFMLQSESQGNLDNQLNLVDTRSGGDVLENGSQEAVSLDQVVQGIKTEYKSDPAFQECTGEIVQSCLSNVIGQKVRETGDLSLCNDFFTDEARESCRIAQSYELARSNRDTTFCEGLPESSRENCLREVATAIAIDTQNITACDALVEAKDECVRRSAERIAYDTIDASWCDNIAEGDRESCVRDVEDLQENSRLQELQVETEGQDASAVQGRPDLDQASSNQ